MLTSSMPSNKLETYSVEDGIGGSRDNTLASETEKNVGKEAVPEDTEQSLLNSAEKKGPFYDSRGYYVHAIDYLNEKIFPLLLSAMEEMLVEARRNDVLQIQKSRFSGLDYLAQALWNGNMRHPCRSNVKLDVFDIPQFKLHLLLHPRPVFPKSWLWSREEGAVRIQKQVRGWLVRKRNDVQELRQFWNIYRLSKVKK